MVIPLTTADGVPGEEPAIWVGSVRGTEDDPLVRRKSGRDGGRPW
jgi:hypothetical protein